MLSAKNKLGVVFFPAFDWCISPTHPERQERLLYTLDQFREEGVFDISGVREYKPDVAGLDDIDRVHFCFPDAASQVTKSHLISAGGAIRAARLVMEKEADKAFALVRPPGHHAMKVVHGNRGFCQVNIEAVMVEYLRERFGPLRVAIVDTDCHHGDGTQDIYWNDPDTLFISVHQDGRTLYPGTGFPVELGGPQARGKTFNIPLPPGTSDEGFLYVLDNLILPILDDFKPDLIINSAGQDNHFSDPITNMNFSAQGYAKLTEKLGAHIAVLEGGYSIQGALPYVNLGITLAMAGLDYSHVSEPGYDPEKLQQSPKLTEYIKNLSEQLINYYFHPPRMPKNGELKDGWFVTRKTVYYDTDNITEYQTESVRICEDCPGVVKISSAPSGKASCLGVEIPLKACPRCLAEGYQAVDQAGVGGLYRHVQLINRKNKEYLRFLI